MENDKMTNDAAVAWVVVGTTEEFGDVILTEYAGTMDDIRNRVMEKARREGFSGHFVERMASLGWRVEPLALATTAAELSAEVERRKDAQALMSQFAKVAEERADAAERRVAELEAGLASARRAIGDHHAPNDCYATGPLTGDEFLDLVQCPACAFIDQYAALTTLRQEKPE